MGKLTCFPLILQTLFGWSDNSFTPSQGYWSPGEWSQCSMFEKNSVCGFGSQIRNISCVEFPSSPPRTTQPWLCRDVPKPQQERLCAVRCSPDCELGPWQGWGPCTCQKPFRNQETESESLEAGEDCADCSHRRSSRTRRVVVPPSHSGNPCPPRIQRRPCDPARCRGERGSRAVPVQLPLTGREEPIVYVGPWSPCTKPVRHTVKRDVRDRNLVGALPLRHKDNVVVAVSPFPPHPFLPTSPGSSQAFPPPHGEHQSFRPGSFSSYRQQQWDGRPDQPASRGPTKPPNNFFQPNEMRFQGMVKLPSFPSEPVLKHPLAADPVDLHVSGGPQLGVRQREVLCRGRGGEVKPFKDCMDGSRSTLVPASKQTCVVQINCQVGEWSSWSEVEPRDCLKERGNAVREERRRDILRFGTSEGDPCPNLIQRRLSNRTLACNQRFVWKVGSWSECTIGTKSLIGDTQTEQGEDSVEKSAPCEGGVRTRNATCLDTSAGRPAPPHLCLRDVQLFSHLLVERCSIECEEKCKVGPWTPWSRCQPDSCLSKSTASVHGYQIRRREMTNVRGDSRSCPAMEEVRSCSLDSCYTWRTEFTGSCQLSGSAGQLCGAGFRQQEVRCVHWDGSEVTDESLCGSSPRPRSEVECHIPCPNDCILDAWSTWSTCPSLSCTNHQNHPRIPLRQRNRTIVAMSGRGGQGCPGPDSLVEMSACPHLKTDCETVSWEPQDWEECQLAPGQTCGRGLQTRKVHCVDKSGRRLPAWRCSRLKTRMRRRECQIICPINCEVSDWTEWSRCPDLCQEGSSEGGVLLMETQRRERIILEEPQHGGERCPALVQVRPCPLLAGSCKEARWSADEWSNCTLAPGLSCGEGLRTRDLSCLRSGLSLPLVECIKIGDPQPVQVETCHIDCSGSCILSSWSAWSACPRSCESTRSRRRSTIDDSKCKNRSLNTEETEPCPCDSYTSKPVGQWSDCILQDQLDVSPDLVMKVTPLQRLDCGQGRRTRRMDCYDSKGNLVDSSWCGESMFLEEGCTIPCPSDCIYSPWGDWGPCDSVCGPGLKNRTAKILQIPGEGGRPCPGPTVQYAGCDYPCENFVWSTGAWSTCGGRHERCGRGTRKRTVRCVELVGEEEIVVMDRFCDPGSKPEISQECDDPCPGQCVVSEWSTWSTCQDCSWGSRRYRQRLVLRQPDLNSLICPPVQESSSCLLNSSCWEYNWKLTPWTSCQPSGQSSCGTGLMKRGKQCIRIDGRPVKSSHCSLLDPPGDLEISCSLECPLDCVLSPWSPWDNSNCECGLYLANITRTRSILVEPSTAGRPCSGSLEERKPCPSVPCYGWKKEPWSRCLLQGATCGTGIMKREVKCVTKPGGVEVPASLCKGDVVVQEDSGLLSGQTEDLSTFAACYISCDSDCTVSSWSEWSSCTQDICTPMSSVGSQTRRRTIVQTARGVNGKCPPQLTESRKCVTGPCYRYHWVVLNGDVFCQRSDGVRVNSGCESSVVGCGADCQTVRHAACQAGHCVCEAGYSPQFSAHPSPRLSACILVQSNFTSQNLEVNEGKRNEDVQLQYFPDGKLLSYWMFALITIGCIFIIFLGISIYILCKSTCKNDYSDPDIPNNRVHFKRQETPLPPLWQ